MYIKQRTEMKKKGLYTKINVRPGGQSPVDTYIYGELISGRSDEPSKKCTHSLTSNERPKDMYALKNVK